MSNSKWAIGAVLMRGDTPVVHFIMCNPAGGRPTLFDTEDDAQTFLDSYRGLAFRTGVIEVAYAPTKSSEEIQ